MTEDDGTLDLDSGEKAADIKDSKRNANLVKAGIGIGIGSAAIVAAMLYANHNKKKKDD
jgi:hypothetical protein